MEILFYKNTYLKTFKADIIETKKIDDIYYIKLDKTAFFNGGGGQFCDTGTIANSKVFDVIEEKGEIIHLTKDKPEQTKDVLCNIDWNRRKDGMTQHLGQHVLSGCFFEKYGANTCSFHLGADVSTVDILGNMDREKVEDIELYANKIIDMGIDVESFVPTKEELVEISLRRELPKTNDEIRIVKIGDLDINACCGVHLKNTLELLFIKIIKFEKYKGNTRITYLAGERAVQYILRRDNYFTDSCKYLSTNEENILHSIKNIEEKAANLASQNKKLEDELVDYKVSELLSKTVEQKGKYLIKESFQNKDITYVRKILEKIIVEENHMVFFCVQNNNILNLIFGCNKKMKDYDMSAILKDTISNFSGKGGGSKNIAQGTLNDNFEVKEIFDYIKID